MKKILGLINSEIIIFWAMVMVLTASIWFGRYIENPLNPTVISGTFNVEKYEVYLGMNLSSDLDTEVLKIAINGKNINYISESWIEAILILSVFLTLVMNVVMISCSIVEFVFKTIKYTNAKRIIIANNIDLTDECLYELPKYNVLIADTIYKRGLRFEDWIIKAHNFFKKKKVLDDENNLVEIKDFDLNNLSDIEKVIIERDSNEISDETKKKYKKTIEEELYKLGFIKENKIKLLGDKFLNDTKDVRKKLEDIMNERGIKYTLISLAFLIILANVIKLLDELTPCVIIALFFVLIKYFRICLTEEGKLERAKLIYIIKNLKKKKELTEKEKYFLAILG